MQFGKSPVKRPHPGVNPEANLAEIDQSTRLVSQSNVQQTQTEHRPYNPRTHINAMANAALQQFVARPNTDPQTAEA